MRIPRFSQWLSFRRAGQHLRFGVVLAGLGVTALVASAQEPAKAEAQHEVTDATSKVLEKIRPLMSDPNNPDAVVQNAPKILETLNALIATVSPKSYDYAYANQMKMQVLLKTGKHLEAIEPLEACIKENMFPPDKILEMKFYLAGLYFQSASGTNDENLRKSQLLKCRGYADQWLQQTSEPMLGAPEMQRYCDVMLMKANALYYMSDFKGALEIAQKAIRLTIEPKDITWVLVFACQQQAGMPEAAAETFELFLEKFPGKKDYWPQLAQAYLYADQKLRAILTYERAQTKGAMSAPGDYANLFNLYFMIQEYSRAADLLVSWIKSGKVENSEDNWDRVSYCYQMMRREDEVRQVLRDARKLFRTGNLDFSLAQYLWYDGKYEEGLKVASDAWKKGGLAKPGRVALFLSTAYFEQREMQTAYDFLQQAIKLGDADKKDIERVSRFVIPGYNEWKARQAEAAPKS